MKRNRTWKIKAVLICICIMAELVCFFLVIQHLENRTVKTVGKNIEKENFSNAKTESNERHEVTLYGKKYFYTDDIRTYLILGTDNSGNELADHEAYSGSMADMILVFVVNYTQKTHAVLQLNRDTITEIQLIDQNGEGEATAWLQLCTAHWYGGSKEQSCENTVRAVSNLLGGISIDAYYALTWEAIKILNREVGGVTVTVEEDLTKADASLKKGETITLNDEQAYHFVRMRQDAGDEDNLPRMSRHRQYLSSLTESVRKKTEEDRSFPVKLYETLSEYATTDLTGKDLSEIVNRLSDSRNLGIYTIEGESGFGSRLGDGIEHAEYYLDESSHTAVEEELFGIVETGKDADK